jgi:hypothetical protein
MEEVAARMPGAWGAAGTALYLATIEANKEFEALGLRNCFKWLPLPQPDHGNYAHGKLYHQAHKGGLSLSERAITATFAGTIVVEPSVNGKLGQGPYRIEEMDQSKWSVLLADIFDADTDSA